MNIKTEKASLMLRIRQTRNLVRAQHQVALTRAVFLAGDRGAKRKGKELAKVQKDAQAGKGR